MKKYQGSWHVEQKPVFPNSFFIECKDETDLQGTLDKQKWSSPMKKDIISGITTLLPEQELFLKNLMQLDLKKISMSTGYIKDGVTHIIQGPLQEKESLICKIDRHKRLAKLEISLGETRQEMSAGLEIVSKN